MTQSMTQRTTVNTEPYGFQASWGASRPSFAYVVPPSEDENWYHPAYLAVYVGGLHGIRINIKNPDDAETLADLLVQVAKRFRQGEQTGVWDETDIHPHHGAHNDHESRTEGDA